MEFLSVQLINVSLAAFCYSTDFGANDAILLQVATHTTDYKLYSLDRYFGYMKKIQQQQHEMMYCRIEKESTN